MKNDEIKIIMKEMFSNDNLKNYTEHSNKGLVKYLIENLLNKKYSDNISKCLLNQITEYKNFIGKQKTIIRVVQKYSTKGYTYTDLAINNNEIKSFEPIKALNKTVNNKFYNVFEKISENIKINEIEKIYTNHIYDIDFWNFINSKDNSISSKINLIEEKNKIFSKEISQMLSTFEKSIKSEIQLENKKFMKIEIIESIKEIKRILCKFILLKEEMFIDYYNVKIQKDINNAIINVDKLFEIKLFVDDYENYFYSLNSTLKPAVLEKINNLKDNKSVEELVQVFSNVFILEKKLQNNTSKRKVFLINMLDSIGKNNFKMIQENIREDSFFKEIEANLLFKEKRKIFQEKIKENKEKMFSEIKKDGDDLYICINQKILYLMSENNINAIEYYTNIVKRFNCEKTIKNDTYIWLKFPNCANVNPEDLLCSLIDLNKDVKVKKELNLAIVNLMKECGFLNKINKKSDIIDMKRKI